MIEYYIMAKRFFPNGIYHIFNKSISNYGIFSKDESKQRFINILAYYNESKTKISFSRFKRKNREYQGILLSINNNSLIKFLCYCLMPDHYHLLVKIIDADKISKYIGDIENSFTKNVNQQNNRKGPLWQSRFKAVEIKSNEQLLHVSRYIHLNPVTKGFVENAEDWSFSSYRLILENPKILNEYLKEISILNISTYKKFVEDNKDYQRKLRSIKKLLLE